LEDLKKNNLEYISKEDPRRRTLKLSQEKKKKNATEKNKMKIIKRIYVQKIKKEQLKYLPLMKKKKRAY